MIQYQFYPDGSWWIYIFKWGIICRPAGGFKFFSERYGYRKWYYIGKYKYSFACKD